MLPLKIKRQRDSEVDPKQVLRAHVEGLSRDKQREFIAFALQLIAERANMIEAETGVAQEKIRSLYEKLQAVPD
jgi:hypothetical protein